MTNLSTEELKDFKKIIFKAHNALTLHKEALSPEEIWEWEKRFSSG